MEKLETFIERIIFAGRWFLAPLYIGLLLTLVPILYRFFHSFWYMMTHIVDATASEITLEVLELLDTVLLANLIIIVLFAGYENFVSKITIAEGAKDRPHWMGHVDYSGLKIKLIGSLVAISVIELLKDFMQEGPYDAKRQGWRIGIHMTFVISGVLFALMDMMADRHKSQR
ncbi:unannotated protein [freshwater metagenome]|uniref:Unannotated protein n=1 Tax=freshwater metagenome TaxID=449393 RepID=A0A6J7EY20_9ZZZZ|nr:TIGR00645 family protein [Actinomycetota bacterium]